MLRIVLGLLTLFALSAAPLTSAQDAATPVAAGALGLPEIEITVSDDGWDAPSEVPAGRYLVTASYDGEKDFGTAAFLRLPADWGIDDLNEQLARSEAATSDQPSDGTTVNDPENTAPDLEWLYELTLAGGVSPVPGETAQGIIDLFPGEWAIWADDFTPDAIPLTVTGQMPTDLPEPEASVTVTGSGANGSFDFSITGSMAAGAQIIKVVNASNQPHFAEFVHLTSPVTPEQVSAYFETPEGEAPDPESGLPADFEVHLSPLYGATQSPGSTQWIVATLNPGSYAIICWLPDPANDNVSHALSGMIEVFEVTG